MTKTIWLQLSKQEQEICWYRIVQNIIGSLPEDYPFFDDAFELEDLAIKIDNTLRKIKK